MIHELTVTSVKGDVHDVTQMGGPPSVVVGDWVTVTATNGELTVTQRVRLDDQPRVGERITVEVQEDQ